MYTARKRIFINQNAHFTMKKIYLFLSFALLFFVNSYSQNVTVEVDGDNLFYHEP